VAVQEFDVPDSFEERTVATLALPADALIVTRVRGDEVSVAKGNSVIKPGDRLLLASTTEAMADVARIFGIEGSGS
jgi:Trk K+ transport system NAD-binding subunit